MGETLRVTKTSEIEISMIDNMNKRIIEDRIAIEYPESKFYNLENHLINKVNLKELF